MAHVDVTDVSQWLESTKLNITTLDTQFEATAFEVVASKLSVRYNTALWTSTANTPSLVKKIIGMMVAGYTYNRQYSENEDLDKYGFWLLNYADNLITGLATGVIDLVDTGQGLVDTSRQPFSFPVFWPNDQSTLAADAASGGDPRDPLASPREFTMGQVF
jgi:hypothetical protein